MVKWLVLVYVVKNHKKNIMLCIAIVQRWKAEKTGRDMTENYWLGRKASQQKRFNNTRDHDKKSNTENT